jgi:hypothetical protein
MGIPKTPAPVKLIAGLLASDDGLLTGAVAVLRERLGPIDAASASAAWDVSTYYRAEMGSTIRRQFVSFERLFPPDELGGIKHATNEMEAIWHEAGGRRVNIDPGYIAAAKLVLASTKDAAHRVYMGRGIYAEVTLHFADGSFRPHAQTYPDYAAPAAVTFFNGVRLAYLAQLRAQ